MRVFYVDQALVGNRGHYLHYALALSGAIRNCGREVTIIANRRLEPGLVGKFKVIQAFTSPSRSKRAAIQPRCERSWRSLIHVALRFLSNMIPYGRWRRHSRSSLDFLRGVRITVSDWTHVDTAVAFSASDLIILNSIVSSDLLAFVRWMSERSKETRPIAVAILHGVPGLAGHKEYQVIDRGRWRRAFEDMEKNNLSNRIFFLANSLELSKEYGRLSSHPIPTVPYPHFCFVPEPQQFRGRGAPTVVFLGVVSATSGFLLLPHVLEALRSELDAGLVKFTFRVHVVEHSTDLRDAVSILERFPIRLAHGELHLEEYGRLLAASDILLQPGDPDYYSKQISGMFVDCRAEGLVTVVPAGTLMAKDVASSGGGVIVAEQSADAYARGIREALAQFDRLSREAATLAPSWRRKHSPFAIIQQIDSLLPKDHLINRLQGHLGPP